MRFVKKKKKLNEWNLNPVLVEREMGGKSGFEQHHSHGRDGVLSRGVSKSKSNIKMRKEESVCSSADVRSRGSIRC